MNLTEEQRGTVAIDLEKAREAVHTLENFAFASGKITAGQIQDVTWGARLLAASTAEIERLRAENLELQVAVFGPDGIRANQACIIADQAASISELEIEITELKADLEQSERVIDQQAAKIKELETAYLKAQNSNLLRKQEIERLRPFEIAARDLDSDLGKIAGERDEQSARIKELEDAHKRAGAKYAKIIRELRSSVYANIPGLKKQWDEVLAEGKIGNGDHIVETDQMIQNGKVWQITEERKAAIDRGMRFLAWSNANTNDPETELDLVVLRAMLEEAGL
ncbi:MAG: hypothetical protein WC343_07575 [Bacilli bacterium]|jgi:chromosome segregation ATPase